jgi:hypothetical protein
MCLSCGYYKGRQVIDLAAKKTARNERMQAKRDAIGAQKESMAPNEATAVSEAPAAESK